METIKVKDLSKEMRRNFLLSKLQCAANRVLWDIRDDDKDIMVDIQQYKLIYKIYRNIKLMAGENIYNSPRIDLNI